MINLFTHVGTVVKQSALQCRRPKRRRFDPWVRKTPWSRKWQPIPVSLPGKFHGQRRLAGYSLWSHRVLDMTEHTHMYMHEFYRMLEEARNSMVG